MLSGFNCTAFKCSSHVLTAELLDALKPTNGFVHLSYFIICGNVLDVAAKTEAEQSEFYKFQHQMLFFLFASVIVFVICRMTWRRLSDRTAKFCLGLNINNVQTGVRRVQFYYLLCGFNKTASNSSIRKRCCHLQYLMCSVA